MEPDAQWIRPAYTQLQKAAGQGHSVRTERWRYTEWDGGEKGAQLYDHEKDPHEYANLASDPGFAGVVAKMKTLLDQNWPSRGAATLSDSRAKKKREAAAK